MWVNNHFRGRWGLRANAEKCATVHLAGEKGIAIILDWHLSQSLARCLIRMKQLQSFTSHRVAAIKLQDQVVLVTRQPVIATP
jgi:hypothetical protein